MRMRLPWMVSVLVVLLTSCGRPSASPTPTPIISDLDGRIQRVEDGLFKIGADGQPIWGDRATLAERMEHYEVPGVGIAVINDYQIEWAKGYGVLEAGGDERVTPDTLFHACSIVKTLSAAAALTLVESGMLELDGDVNDKLVSWRVPQNEFTVEEKVTLRRLLSHSAGLTDDWSHNASQAVECCYAVEGESPTVTIQQMLEAAPVTGLRYPARVTVVPGTEYRYANLGYGIVQLLIEDVTQESFAAFMQETVLDPLGMTSSTFEQPLPGELRARAATEHDSSGKPFEGKRHHFPALAAGGLWTTPTDLARFAIGVMRAYEGESGRLLSTEMVRQMLTPQIEILDESLEDACGLGFFLADDRGALRMSFTGTTWGSSNLLWAYPETGQGVVIMTNSASASGIIRLEILLSVAVEYGWPLIE